MASESSQMSGEIPNWQAKKATLKDRFGYIFNTELLADIHFLVGKDSQKKRIPAHKLVLSVGSSVFNAMFNGPLAEKDAEIELPDMDPDAFLCLLKFIYTEEGLYSQDIDAMIATIYAAIKYDVPALRQQCANLLLTSVQPRNAFSVLSHAFIFQEEMLMNKCWEVIDQNPVTAFTTQHTDISIGILLSSLRRNSLQIFTTDEVMLFKFLVDWSVAECRRQEKEITPENQREVMGGALSLIRFPLMTSEQFADDVTSTGILSDEEMLNVFLYINRKMKPCVDFPCNFRGAEHRMKRVSSKYSSKRCPPGTHEVGFTVDRDIFLTGFQMFTVQGCEFEINVQEYCSRATLASQNASPIADNTYASDIRFTEPVRIHAHKEYRAQVTLSKETHAKNCGNSFSDTYKGKNVSFKFFNIGSMGYREYDQHTDAGQMPEFLFYI